MWPKDVETRGVSDSVRLVTDPGDSDETLLQGVNCEVDVNECASNPCQNSARCEDGVNRYTCQCILGFDGVNCEVNADPCAGVTCLNGAQVGPRFPYLGLELTS